MRLATLRDGTCVEVVDDGLVPLAGTVEEHLLRSTSAGHVQRGETGEFGAPVTPRQIVCLGLNYRDHAEEAGLDLPPQPLLFMKAPGSVAAHKEPIRMPQGCTQLDYEAELAVVIGRPGRNVSVDQAHELIGGYTCFNDVSDREAQMSGGQWFRGKSFRTFGPLGPWIVTVDELGLADNLAIECRVNGSVRQRSSTSQLVFPVAEIVSYCSRLMDLLPGDVIATGTPGGVAYPNGTYLQPGDSVEVEIEGIGVLQNTVVASQ